MGDWSDVPGFPGYQAHPTGALRSLRRRQPRVLRPMVSPDGYLFVLAAAPGARHRKLSVHVAVLTAFIGPRPDGMEARHLDGNPSNNTVQNLAWGTRTEQAADRRAHGTEPRGESKGSAVLSESQVREARALRSQGWTLRQIAALYGCSHTSIRKATNGERWRHVA